MPTSLGISETRNWRIGGEDERLDMRTAMDCAWMLDGVIEDRACALSLASRYGSRFILTLFKLGRLPRLVAPRITSSYNGN
ncbi:hypothetical protein PIB30_039717 [Stylosanthes scabra]|uniref:Uncharacterized protein n=1 Tax=Stylosanthes scabra TaxID=79078 RepID=A0ABU6ZD41_9FABA|nr:hypothetical protein [Stylosanthes scabra]